MKLPAALLGFVAAIAVVVATAGCASPTTTASAHLASIQAGQLGGAFTSSSVGSAEQILASAGVATVSDERSTAPIDAVHGSSALTFTAAQVRSMTLEAAGHGGITGATLDAAAPVASDIAPFAYLLAAWVKDASTPGAVAMRRVMGVQPWTDAPKITFPTIALALFAADVVASLPAPQRTPSGLGTEGPASPSEAAFLSVGNVDAGIFSAACSTASGFIQTALASIANALQFGGSSTGVSGFFGSILRGAIGLAQQAISGLLSVVTGPVLNAIKTVAGTAAVIAQVVSYLKPWSVKVTADPASVNAGDGGTLKAVVDTGTGGANYPSTVKDCADALGITLPSLTAANAKGVWDVTGAISTSDASDVTLDEHSTSSISFNSEKSDSGATCSSGGQEDKAGTARITVTRQDTDGIKQLATSLLSHELGVAGSIIGPVLSSILSPIFDSVIATVSSLTDTSGSTIVAVVEPSSGSGSGCDNASQATNTPEPKKSAVASCLVGTWKTTLATFYVPGRTLTGLAGATWTIDSSGKATENYGASSALGGAFYGGTEIAIFVLPSASVASGPLLESAVLSSTVNIEGHSVAIPTFSNAGGVGSNVGTYTCSPTSLVLKFNGAFPETWSFVRE